MLLGRSSQQLANFESTFTFLAEIPTRLVHLYKVPYPDIYKHTMYKYIYIYMYTRVCLSISMRSFKWI